ncbi:MAG: cytochrome c family protein [Hyphomicrobiales bacterium]|nr:cytochrome c family protein [Hyphomicrobiales bacterium]
MARVLRHIAYLCVAVGLATPAIALEGNVDAGKKVFAKCGVCHGIGDVKKPIGPNLNNVVGRPAATQPEFLAKGAAGYSKAMVAAGAGGLVWTEDQIAEWVANPKKKIPGTKMAFPGLSKEQDIADVIAYVKTFSQ